MLPYSNRITCHLKIYFTSGQVTTLLSMQRENLGAYYLKRKDNAATDLNQAINENIFIIFLHNDGDKGDFHAGLSLRSS